MPSDLLFRGILAGIVIAAPVGAVGLLCIRRALADGRLAAFAAGLGAALADTLYGAIAAFGISAFAGWMYDHQQAFFLFGGAFLIFLGFRTWRTKLVVLPVEQTDQSLDGDISNAKGLTEDFISTFVITFTNPLTIIGFMALFSKLIPPDLTDDFADTLEVILGVFIGSTAWWFGLATLAALARRRFRPGWLSQLNRVTGLVLIGFGLLVLGSLATHPDGPLNSGRDNGAESRPGDDRA